MALREKGGVLLGFHRIPVTEVDAAMDELEAVILEEGRLRRETCPE